MKKLIKFWTLATVCLIFLLSACSSEVIIIPGGYKIIKSLDGTKYTCIFPDGRIGANVWDNEIDVARHILGWEKIKDEPYTTDADKYKWALGR